MKKIVILVFLITVVIFATSCEKVMKNKDDIKTDYSEFVDISFYSNLIPKNNENNNSNVNDKPNERADCGLYDLPYRFVTQKETSIQLPNGDWACLKTDCGNCFPEIIIRPEKSHTISAFDILQKYENNYVDYFKNENFKEIFPMLKESFVTQIINNKIIMTHKFNRNTKISFFNFAYYDNQENIFTIQINRKDYNNFID